MAAPERSTARQLMADLASLMLWELQAIQVNVEEPFRLTSGNWSPIYVNCRRVISDAAAMDIVASFAHWTLQSERVHTDMLAGGETAGIPFASFLAARLGKPMVYVRKRPKEHGISGLVEGQVTPGQRVLLVEDLITDGQSKLDFIRPLREAGSTVEHCLVLFDRLQGGRDVLAAEGVTLHAITDVRQALGHGLSTGLLSEAGHREVESYLSDAEKWHKERGREYKSAGGGHVT